MLAVLIVGVFGLLVAALASSVLDHAALSLLDRRVQLQAAQAVVLDAVESYYKETGAPPASVKELARLPQYKHLCGYLGKPSLSALNQSGTSADHCSGDTARPYDLVVFKGTPAPGFSGALSAGNLQYARVGVLTPLKPSMTADDFVTTNRCGTGDFASGSAWCGDEKLGYWALLETKDLYRGDAVRAKLDAALSLRKITDAGLPSGLSSGSSMALKQLVSVPSGSATGTSVLSCTGVFTLSGSIGTAVLDCTDLYNRFGDPVTLARAGSSLTLSSPLRYLAADGSAVDPATATRSTS